MRVVVVGGGCSGVMAAISVKNDSNEVILLERGEDVLKKLLMTGNGRCNYFNEDQNINHYHSRSGDVSSFMKQKYIDEYLSFFDRMGVIPRIKNGYYYPYVNQASSIRDDFLYLLKEKNIDVHCNYLVESIEKKNDLFVINHELECDCLILATGSFAYPKTGSDGMGYHFLELLGHTIIKPLPSLVALKSNRHDMKYLSGVRAECKISLLEDGEVIRSEEGEVQFTDYGISGICTFNVSYDVSIGLSLGKREEIQINFISFVEDPNTWMMEYKNKITSYSLNQVLENIVPKKIVPSILRDSALVGDVLFNSLTLDEIHKLVYVLTHFSFPIIGTLDYEHSQVCSGGVSLEEVNSNTYESLIIPHLYITGELLDLTGDCGGYNLTIAFMSGFVAGRSIREYDSN